MTDSTNTTAGCNEYQAQILLAAAGDLEASQHEALEKHLAGCASCAEESALYAATLRDLRQLTDVPVPRHFFVHSPQERANPWYLFTRMSFGWRLTVSAALTALAVVGILAATRIQIRVEKNALTLAFGSLPAVAIPAAPQPEPVARIDTKAIQDEIVRVLEEKNRKENLAWVRTLRAEITRAGAKWNEEQRLVVATALAGLEARMDGRIATASQTVRESTDRSLADLYHAVTLDREQDSAALNARINRVGLAAEAKGSQNDAILDTLLQVADLRLK